MVPIPPGELVLFDAQNGAKINAAVGQVLNIRLGARPGTGYGWRVTSGPPALTPISQSYDPHGAPPPHILGPKALGPGPTDSPVGQQVFRMRVAGRPGQTIKLSMVYTRGNLHMTLAKVYQVKIKVLAAHPA